MQGDGRHLRWSASRRAGDSPKHGTPSRFDRAAENAPAWQRYIRRALRRSRRRLPDRGVVRSARSASSSRRLVSRKCCADAASTSERTAIRRRRAARGSSAKKLRSSSSDADRSASSKWAENMPNCRWLGSYCQLDVGLRTGKLQLQHVSYRQAGQMHKVQQSMAQGTENAFCSDRMRYDQARRRCAQRSRHRVGKATPKTQELGVQDYLNPSWT